MTFDQVIREQLGAVVREEIRAAFAEFHGGGDEKPATYEQAAKFAECSKATIGAWVKAGELPSTGSGRLRRVLLSDVTKALAKMKVKAPGAGTPKARALELLNGVRRAR
jgi:excisionase family DNA binding protein